MPAPRSRSLIADNALNEPVQRELDDVEFVDPFSGVVHHRTRVPRRNVTPVIERVVNTFPAGVAIVATMSADGPVGLTVGTVSRLSVDPPLVLFAVSRASKTWAAVPIGLYCISLLSESQAALALRFAMGRPDRFADVGWSPSLSLGMPAIDGALAYFECVLEHNYPGGDHLIVVGRVVNVYYQRRPRSKPLLSYRREFWTIGSAVPVE